MRDLREARGLGVKHLAERAGADTMTIVRLERGHGRSNQADLERFGAALGVAVEALIEPAS
jgi:transcriptional regulator with XRE-family HTH domain